MGNIEVLISRLNTNEWLHIPTAQVRGALDDCLAYAIEKKDIDRIKTLYEICRKDATAKEKSTFTTAITSIANKFASDGDAHSLYKTYPLLSDIKDELTEKENKEFYELSTLLKDIELNALDIKNVDTYSHLDTAIAYMINNDIHADEIVNLVDNHLNTKLNLLEILSEKRTYDYFLTTINKKELLHGSGRKRKFDCLPKSRATIIQNASNTINSSITVSENSDDYERACEDLKFAAQVNSEFGLKISLDAAKKIAKYDIASALVRNYNGDNSPVLDTFENAFISLVDTGASIEELNNTTDRLLSFDGYKQILSTAYSAYCTMLTLLKDKGKGCSSLDLLPITRRNLCRAAKEVLMYAKSYSDEDTHISKEIITQLNKNDIRIPTPCALHFIGLGDYRLMTGNYYRAQEEYSFGISLMKTLDVKDNETNRILQSRLNICKIIPNGRGKISWGTERKIKKLAREAGIKRSQSDDCCKDI